MAFLHRVHHADIQVCKNIERFIRLKIGTEIAKLAQQMNEHPISTIDIQDEIDKMREYCSERLTEEETQKIIDVMVEKRKITQIELNKLARNEAHSERSLNLKCMLMQIEYVILCHKTKQYIELMDFIHMRDFEKLVDGNSADEPEFEKAHQETNAKFVAKIENLCLRCSKDEPWHSSCPE
jgi:hypothetical protein